MQWLNANELKTVLRRDFTTCDFVTETGALQSEPVTLFITLDVTIETGGIVNRAFRREQILL